MRFTLAIFLLLVIVEIRSDSVATAKGLTIFKAQVLLTHLFLTINAIFGFSQVIIEERESGTLDLLKLADINSLSVVLGKGLPRFWECLLLTDCSSVSVHDTHNHSRWRHLDASSCRLCFPVDVPLPGRRDRPLLLGKLPHK